MSTAANSVLRQPILLLLFHGVLACRLLTARFFFQDPVNIPADLLNFLYFIFQREISIGYAVSSKRWVLRLPRFSDTRQSDFGFALHKKAENEAHNGGGFLVNNPKILAVGVFHIAVGGFGGDKRSPSYRNDPPAGTARRRNKCCGC